MTNTDEAGVSVQEMKIKAIQYVPGRTNRSPEQV